MKIAALFVDLEGTYRDAPDVDLWGEDRDAGQSADRRHVAHARPKPA